MGHGYRLPPDRPALHTEEKTRSQQQHRVIKGHGQFRRYGVTFGYPCNVGGLVEHKNSNL